MDSPGGDDPTVATSANNGLTAACERAAQPALGTQASPAAYDRPFGQRNETQYDDPATHG